MNNHEAISILGQYDVSNIHFYTTDGEEIPFTEWSDAIEMAISALKAQDLQPTCNQLATDTISRKAAIEAIRAMQTYKLFAGDDMRLVNQAEAMTELMMLPSTQPDLPEWARKVEEYRKSAPDTIYNPLAWALYQVWKEYDR